MFIEWYEGILPEAVTRSNNGVERVLMYRDVRLGIEHAPDVAAPWALMVQYLLPFDQPTALDIWEVFAGRFVSESGTGMWVAVTPDSEVEDIRATCLATWLAAEVGDTRRYEALLQWVDHHYEPEIDKVNDEFAYWFNLDETYPRGQWNNAIMNAFCAPRGTWTSLLQMRDEPS